MSDTATVEAALDSQETWQSTTGGTTYVSVKDPRNPRGWVRRKVGGRGSKRITLTVEERLFNQELVTYENEHLDPFRNGLLIRIQPVNAERSQFEVTDEELVALLTSGEDEEFGTLIANTHSEVIVRRLLFLAERNATKFRYDALQDLVGQRYPAGKTSRVYREYIEELEKNAGADL